MSSEKSGVLSGPMGKMLSIEDFQSLATKLAEWRSDPFIKLMDSNKSKGRILSFVKGLRLSAQIAYLIRNIISTGNIEVNWGHLVDDKGESCSPECDIILHQPGYIQRWNGSDRPIMDFKFIERKNVLGIVSCKSLTRSIDKEYCKDFQKYKMKNIFLFAECCNSKSVDRLQKQAKDAGYKNFFYLYTFDKNGYFHFDQNVYINFIKAIQALSTT